VADCCSKGLRILSACAVLPADIVDIFSWREVLISLLAKDHFSGSPLGLPVRFMEYMKRQEQAKRNLSAIGLVKTHVKEMVVLVDILKV
jgi:hypothetical protein